MTKEPIEVNGLQGPLFVRSIKLSEKIGYQRMARDESPEAIALLLHLCVVDKDGERIKTQDEWDEWAGIHEIEAVDAFKSCHDFIMPSGEVAEDIEKK